MIKALPSCPNQDGKFDCPICKAPSRDKITAMRHYGFAHRKVFELCDESDFKPRPKDHPIKSVPKGHKFKTGNNIILFIIEFIKFSVMT